MTSPIHTPTGARSRTRARQTVRGSAARTPCFSPPRGLLLFLICHRWCRGTREASFKPHALFFPWQWNDDLEDGHLSPTPSTQTWLRSQNHRVSSFDRPGSGASHGKMTRSTPEAWKERLDVMGCAAALFTCCRHPLNMSQHLTPVHPTA